MNIPRFLLAAALAAALPAQSAVQVTFVDPDNYTDLANERFEMKSVMDALAAHFKKLGERYLAPDETLKVEVLDVDMAGWPRWAGRAPDEVRVARGGADWPQMHLRYTLESRSRPQSGDEKLSDPLYLNRGYSIRSSSEPYFYEKRMLEDWFRSRFAQAPR